MGGEAKVDGMVEKEGWTGREIEETGKQIDREGGGGRMRISVTWSHSPERNKQKQEAQTRQTSLNYRAET